MTVVDRRSRSVVLTLLAVIVLLLSAGVTRATAATTSPSGPTATTATSPPPPAKDPFYRYTGTTPLSQIAPGTVLNTRTVAFHIAGIPTPISVVQLLYRSTSVNNTAVTNVTSVLLPPVPSLTPHLVAYGSFYDSLNRNDEPSYTFAGAPYGSGRQLPTEEAAFIVPLLLSGDTVSVADTEGQNPNFAIGPEYGMLTLDGIRAAEASSATGLSSTTPTALMGYSGGAIATGWAAQMAPTYAPDVESNLVGATMGGVLVEPSHNLNYVSGSTDWAGVIPMALLGASRAYHLSLTPYLSAYGAQVFATIKNQGIDQVDDEYPNLQYTQLVQPQYANPDTIRPYVQITNRLILGHAALPKIPLQIVQGAGGTQDGTNGSQPGIGPGDGVMITGDVRTYAREACAAGDPVDYTELDQLDHTDTGISWGPQAAAWLATRFAGATAPTDCSSIAPGNPLNPIQYQPPAG